MSVAEPWFVSIAIWNTVENLVKFDGTPKKARMLVSKQEFRLPKWPVIHTRLLRLE